jgi:hypothetical protein
VHEICLDRMADIRSLDGSRRRGRSLLSTFAAAGKT